MLIGLQYLQSGPGMNIHFVETPPDKLVTASLTWRNLIRGGLQYSAGVLPFQQHFLLNHYPEYWFQRKNLMMDNWHLTGEWIIDIQKSYDWSIQYYGSWDRIQNGFSVYSILSTMLVWGISVLTWSWYWINSFPPTWPVTKSFPPGNTSLPSPALTPHEELSMSPSSNMEYIMQGGFRNGSHGMMNYLTYNIFISELYFSVFKRIF